MHVGIISVSNVSSVVAKVERITARFKIYMGVKLGCSQYGKLVSHIEVFENRELRKVAGCKKEEVMQGSRNVGNEASRGLYS
jgi:hypothetical protein